MTAPMTPEPGNDPLIVRRFDIAMEPAPEEEQVLTIGCIATDGRPVALLLNLDDRPKVAGWLALEPGTSMHTTLTGAYLDAWEEQRENARLRLALESARRRRRELRDRVSQLERSAVLAEEDYRRIVRGACQVESQLRARVAELERAAVCSSRISTRDGVSECVLPIRHREEHRNAAKDHYWSDAFADAERPAPVEDPHDSPLRPGACDACGDVPEKWCPDCAACRQGCHGGHDGNPCAHPRAPWGGAV